MFGKIPRSPLYHWYEPHGSPALAGDPFSDPTGGVLNQMLPSHRGGNESELSLLSLRSGIKGGRRQQIFRVLFEPQFYYFLKESLKGEGFAPKDRY